MKWEFPIDDLTKSVDLLEKDLFKFGVPLLKSFQVDANGDVIVEGIASVDKDDHQGEFLDPRGFVLNYFEKSGWIKWEHKGPNQGPALPTQFMGEPVEARITPEGQFYLKARLYRDSPITTQVKEQLEVLEKSQSSRRMGFSIEGQAIQRDPSDPRKVLKAIIRNVVLTMNPVNDGTWVALCKSLTGPDALSVDLDADFSIEKALDTGAMAAVMPQSLEGSNPDDEDETVKALSAFRSYVKRALNKSLCDSLLNTDIQSVLMGAYDHAVDHGLAHSAALEFAKTVYEKREVIKSVSSSAGQGGAYMNKLSQILGESVDALEKSLQAPAVAPTEDEELDELIKSLEGEGGAPATPAAQPATPAAPATGSHDSGVDLTKSMDADAVQILDVSPFLDELVKSFNGQMGEFQQGQEVIAGALGTMAKVLKASSEREKEMVELVKSLQGQVEELGARPAGRRGVTTPTEVATATRQPAPAAGAGGGNGYKKSEVFDLLMKGLETGAVNSGAITSFEMDYPMHRSTAQAIGLDPVRGARYIDPNSN